MVDDREAQGLLADAEDVGHPEGGGPQDGAGEHRLEAVRDGQPAGDPAGPEDGAHVEDRDEGPADPDEEEPQVLRGGAHGHRLHPEQGRPLEDHVGDDVADRRRDGNGGERPQGVVPEDHLVREDDPGDGRVERGRYRGRDPAADPHGRGPLGVTVDPGGEGAQGRPQVGERAVLPDGRAGPEGDQARQGGQEAGAGRDPAVQPLHGADEVGGALGAPLGNQVAVHEPDDEPARGGDADGGGGEQGRVLLHEAAAGRDEQPFVEEEDEVDEPDGRQGGERPHRHAEGGDPCDARGDAQPEARSPVASARPRSRRRGAARTSRTRPDGRNPRSPITCTDRPFRWKGQARGPGPGVGPPGGGGGGGTDVRGARRRLSVVMVSLRTGRGAGSTPW